MRKKVSSCTTILVGKGATFDGSTMMARDEDCSDGIFNPKKRVVIKPANQPEKYKSISSGIEIDLPKNPLQYTSMPDAKEGNGIFGEAGINSLNIAMTATETITSNPLVLGADPLVKSGIGEEDFLTIILPYIKSAKEGVIRIGELLEKYGTYESNGIGFQDENEIWWVETVGGHHFIAKKVPDDAYVVGPNQLGIQSFDFVDSFGEQKNHICSKDLIDFITDNKLDLSFKSSTDLKKEKNFDVRAAFGSHTDSDNSYNTPRGWFMLKYFNPKTYKWDGPNADFTPESFDLPWSLAPERKITIEDIKYILSSYYQGTKYNPYGKHGDLSERKKYRPIGFNRNCQLTLSHIRSNLSEQIKCIEWIAFASNPFNVLIPQYSRVDDVPKYLKDFKDEVDTENVYWTNRLIAALADPNYNEAMPFIERYQNLIASKNHEFINKFDRQFNGKNIDTKLLEDANNEIVDFIKKETSKLLGDVLKVASLKMKNSFSRSDA